MGTLYQRLPLRGGYSFIARTYRTPLFETPWHQHDEFELVLCNGSSGTAFIGNYIGPYHEGEVYLLGNNLPHWFKKRNDSMTGKAIVVQFNKDLFGDQLNKLPELKTIKTLLNLSNSGIQLRSTLNTNIRKKLKKIEHQAPFERYLTLLSCLYDISTSHQYNQLSNVYYDAIPKEEFKRIRKVFEYSYNHFKDNITLQQMADLTNQSVSNFCKYFKQNTKKTYIDFLNDIRLNYACTKLRTSEDSITQICYDSGFRNWSNFSVQFKKRYNASPSEYRKMSE
ncbi:AraC family transcriptional regulator [Marinilabilia rubra]|uniref:AraC family transcriptional regulator n=1 Tax=Marinilabilia rubra TaxID=2162893 RepID=A0A2U2BBZ2_9BACT|nr:AraC family transcriptional regulator [Marinilabilia rubra]PWE00592.1 AraC family transcriptional regulator [Marinilabilia rubra]